MANGKFEGIIDDTIIPKKVDKLILCSGKLYYELLKRREHEESENIALVRLEQLYPLDKEYIKDIVEKYNAKEVFWVQEEPENMGAWLMIRHKLEKVLNETKKGYKLGVIARNLSAAPAGGYQKYHQKRQKEIVTEALEL